MLYNKKINIRENGKQKEKKMKSKLQPFWNHKDGDSSDAIK